jgi:hypothetical protein
MGLERITVIVSYKILKVILKLIGYSNQITELIKQIQRLCFSSSGYGSYQE